MLRFRKVSESQGVSRYVLLSIAAVCLAILPLSPRNALRASDSSLGPDYTVAQLDSIFRTRYDTEENPGKGSGWKAFQRFSWFYSQRAYPNGDIPAGARMLAWEEKQENRHHDPLDENWSAIGPTNLAGRILCLVWHPTDANTIYAGSASGGLWKTTNGGTSWFSLTDDLPSLAVGAVALEPGNPNVIYIGTGEGAFNADAVYGAGVFKSTNGGATWSTTGLSWAQSQNRAINKIVINPSNPQILYAACNRLAGGIFKSTNGGTSWTQYHTDDVKDLIIHPDSLNVLYCVNGDPWGDTANGVYRSTDAGVTWTRLSTGLPPALSMGRAQLSMSASNRQTLYVGIAQTITGGAGLLGVYKTTNAGASWTLQANTPNFYAGQGWYNLVMAVHPTNPAIVYSSGLDCYKSSDSGVNWTRKSFWNYSPSHSQYAHADHHDLIFKPGDPNTILAATDGGIYKSTNGGDTWTPLNSGLATYQFYAMGNDVLNSSVCYGGTQDNGTNKYTGSSTWAWVLSGDGGYCNVDYTNSNIVYAETQRGQHYKSTNAGSSWFYIQSGISGYGAWVTPVALDPTNPNILYTATTRIYKTTNGGTSWSSISGDLSAYYVSTIAIAPSNPQVIYVGCEGGGQVFKTTNGGTNWTSISTGLPSRYITRAAVHPSDPNTVYTTVSGYLSGHVWKSTNGGSTWTNSSTGIPDIPCNVVVIDPNTPTTLYLGTDLGVYHSTDGGASWTDYSAGLPNVVVDDLALHPTSGSLRAATHGRGMWETATGGGQSIAVLTPNGGDVWPTGTSQTITWGTGGIGGNVMIELNRAFSGGTWETVVASTPNDGSYAWTVSGATSTAARIRVTSVETPAATDISNNNFTISLPIVTVMDPNGGETWVIGSVDTVSWNVVGTGGTMVVQLNRTYPSASWETIATTSNLSATYTVTGNVSSTARIRVYLQSNSDVCDTSNANFSVVAPAITVTWPNGGETMTPGQPATFRWTSQYVTGTKLVELNRSYSGGAWEILQASVVADSFVWTPDQNGGSAARIRVTSNTFGTATDISNANCTILSPTLTMVSPNGGEGWNIGSSYWLRWTRTNLYGLVNVHFNNAYPGGPWLPVQLNVAADSVLWLVPAPSSGATRIRVTSVNVPALFDESDGNFAIGTGITVVSPNGGEAWSLNTPVTISWTRANAPGNATVQLNRSYPVGAWETLTTTASGDEFVWNATGLTTTAARVKVFLTGNPLVGDTSNASFNIVQSTLTVTSPNGGEIWNNNDWQVIRWTRLNTPGPVSVLLNRSYSGGAWDTLATSVSVDTFRWRVPNDGNATSAARVKVVWNTQPLIQDESNGNFQILPHLTLLTPNGGDIWPMNVAQYIRWSRSNAANNVRILLTRQFPDGTWSTLTTTASGDSFQFTPTYGPSEICRVAMFLASDYAITDTSLANFAIVNSTSITVTSPNGGEQWAIGSPQTITFSRNNAAGAASAHLNRNYPAGAWELLNNNVTTNSLAWTPSGATSANSRIRVYLNSNPSIRDSSNANFSLTSGAASLTLSAPNGGETWVTGTTQVVRFTRSNASGNVAVLLNRNYPAGGWESLASTVTADTFAWNVSGQATSNARMRIYLVSNSTIADTSANNFTVAVPSITVTVPNGGETWTVGSVQNITFTRSNANGNATVEVNRTYPSGAWELLSNSVSGSSYAWTVTSPTSSTARVRVFLTASPTVIDTSNANFSITAAATPVLTLLAPNGSESWTVGGTQTIRWQRSNAPGNVRILLTRAWPIPNWSTLTTTAAADSFQWTVTPGVSLTSRIAIYLADDWGVGDTSAANFSIVDPSSITVNVPNGGESWTVGSVQNITFTRVNANGNATVAINRTYPSLSWEVLSSTVSGSSYAWTVSGTASSTARVKVYLTALPTVSDTSNTNFSIVVPSAITVTAPNGGEAWNTGSAYSISFTRTNADGAATIELNRNFPAGGWELINSNVTTSSLSWTPSGASTSNARIRVFLNSNPAIRDSSNANFALVAPSITVNAPNGNDTLFTGVSRTITWARLNASGAVTVAVDRNYPSGTWEPITTTSTVSSYAWTVTGPTTNNARIRVSLNSNPSICDTSDANFRIVTSALTVLAPDGGETFTLGGPITVRWNRNYAVGNVTVQLNRTYPAGSWTTLTTAAAADSFVWTSSGAASTSARIRVQLTSNSSVNDVSSANFSLVQRTLALTTHNGGSTYYTGTASAVNFTRTNAASAVTVQLNRTYPSGAWETLTANEGTSSYTWNVAGATSIAARLRIFLTAEPFVCDTSNANFFIAVPSITVLLPNGGESWPTSTNQTITWLKSGVTENVRVELNRDYPAGAWELLSASNTGTSFVWPVVGPTTTGARVRVIALSGAPGDTSNSNFSVITQELSLVTPNGGESAVIGGQLPIRWTRSGLNGNVLVYLNRTYPGGAWTLLGSSTADSLLWTVSAPATNAARIRIALQTNPSHADTSAANFSLAEVSVSLTSPNGGEQIVQGATHTVTWVRNGTVNPVRVLLNTNYPAGAWTTIASNQMGSSYEWQVTQGPTSQARIVVQDQTNPTVTDTSASNFSILLPQLTLLAPNGGEQWMTGMGHFVTFTRANDMGPVTIQINRNYPAGAWQTIASGYTDSSFLWTAQPPFSITARMRVLSETYPGISDTSNANFRLVPYGILLVNPSGPETVKIGDSVSIEWVREGVQDVDVLMDRTYPSGDWETLEEDLDGDVFTWTATPPATPHARFVVRKHNDPSIADTSDGEITIEIPHVTLTAPSGGESFSVNDAMLIEWTRTFADGPARVELNRNYPGGAWEIIADNITENEFEWTVAGDSSSHARVRVSLISDPGISDTCDADFVITLPGLNIVSPTGNDTLITGSVKIIRWQRIDASGQVRVELNRNYPGGSWETLAPAVAVDTFAWTVSGNSTTMARFRVTLVFNQSLTDVSDAYSWITPPTLHLLSPVAGDSIQLGTQALFSWSSVGVNGNVNIYVKRNYPSGQWELLGQNLSGTSWNWTASGSASDVARFRVLSAANPLIVDTTDGPVHLGQPQIIITSPVSAQTYRAGEVVNLAWTRSFAPGNVRVELSRQGTGGPWEEIGTTTDNSITWAVSGPVTSIARLRVTLIDLPWVAAMTSFNSTIVIPSLVITAPVDSGPFAIGRDLTISWQRTYVSEPVNIVVQREGAQTSIETIRTDVAGDSIHWTATGPADENVSIIIQTASGIDVETQSVSFVLSEAQLELVTPTGGESFVEGATLPIRWSRAVVTDPVRVELNRSYPAGSWDVLAASVADTFFNWTVTGPTTTSARIRIISTVDAALNDELANSISLLVPALTITSPAGGERLPIGFATSVSWSRVAVDGAIRLELSRNGGSSYEAITDVNEGDSCVWTPQGLATTNAILRVSSVLNPAISAVSNAFALAQPGIALLSPLGGDSIAIGSTVTVRWSESDHPATINVELNRDYPSEDWEMLAASIETDSFVWSASGSDAMHARLRVVSSVNSTWLSESPADFALLTPAVHITSPSPETELIIGTPISVSWQRVLVNDFARVLLRRTNGSTTVLAEDVSGSEAVVMIPAPAAGSARIIVEDMLNPSRADSVNVAGPYRPMLSILGMEDSSRCIVGQEETISWSREYAEGEVAIQISSDYPVSGWETIGATNGDSFSFVPEGEETESLALRVILTAREDVADTVLGIQVVDPALSFEELTDTDYRIGTPLTVNWHNHEVDGLVQLALNRDFPAGDWETLYEGTDTSFTWTVSGNATDAARLRIVSADYPQAADTSGSPLSFYRPSLALDLTTEADTLFIGRVLNYTLTFEHESAPATVAIQRTPDGEWETIAQDMGEGSHDWLVTAPAGDAVRFRAFVPGDADLDDTSSVFTLLAPSLEFAAFPTGPLTVSDTTTIAWTPLGVEGPMTLWLQRDAEPAEPLLTASFSTSFMWTVAPPRADAARLIVTSDNDPQFADTSDAFAILLPALFFTNPAEQGTDTVGDVVNVSWSWIDDNGAVRLEVSYDGFDGPWNLIADSISETSRNYLVTGPETDDLRYRVSALHDTTLTATSVSRHVVERELSIEQQGGETWYVGEQHWVRWNRQNYFGPVDVEVQRMDRSQPWEPIAQSLSDSILWTVTGPATDFAMLRLVAADHPEVFDTTDAPLRIVNPYVTVVAPNGGEVLEEDQDIRLRWMAAGFEGGIAIGLWRGEPVNQFDTLFLETENDSNEIWTITGPAATGCYLVVFSAVSPQLHDTSDAPFVIEEGNAADEFNELPREFSLSSPYPNPFNSRATIEFALPRNGNVTLTIFDILGREVETLVDEPRVAGFYSLSWDASRHSSGLYFVRMMCQEFVQTRKLHLVK